MQILFVAAEVPTRQQIRAYGLLCALADRGHRIRVVCGAAPGSYRRAADLQERGVEVLAVPQSAAERRRNMLRALPGPLPLRAAAAYGGRLLEAVADEARSGAYDVAHVDGMAASALGYALAGLPAVLDAASCASLTMARRAGDSWRRGAQAALALARTRRHEAAYLGSYERVIAASADDAWALGTLSASPGGPAPTAYVIPTPVESGPAGGILTLREQGTLLLCADPATRAEVVEMMVAAVMPLIWRQRADIRLLIPGPIPAGVDRGATGQRVLSVSAGDTRALTRATIALAPGDALAADAALQALGAGTPLIASGLIGRRLQAADGRDLLLADGPADLARATLALLDDPRYRGQVGRAGRAYVERSRRPGAIAEELERVYAAARGADVAGWSLDVGLGGLLNRELGA